MTASAQQPKTYAATLDGQAQLFAARLCLERSPALNNGAWGSFYPICLLMPQYSLLPHEFAFLKLWCDRQSIDIEHTEVGLFVDLCALLESMGESSGDLNV